MPAELVHQLPAAAGSAQSQFPRRENTFDLLSSSLRSVMMATRALGCSPGSTSRAVHHDALAAPCGVPDNARSSRAVRLRRLDAEVLMRTRSFFTPLSKSRSRASVDQPVLAAHSDRYLSSLKRTVIGSSLSTSESTSHGVPMGV